MHSKVEGMEKGMERKGLRTNMKKTKLMVSGPGLDLLRDSGAFPSAVCRSGVGVNSIQCSQCMYWVHKNTVVLEEDWLRIQTMFVQDAVTRLDRLTIDLSHR